MKRFAEDSCASTWKYAETHTEGQAMASMPTHRAHRAGKVGHRRVSWPLGRHPDHTPADMGILPMVLEISNFCRCSDKLPYAKAQTGKVSEHSASCVS